MVDDLAAHFSCEIAVLGLADIEFCIPEQTGAVCLHCTHMVGILVGDKNMPDGLRVDAQPAHFFLQPVVVVPGVDHNIGIAFAVEEDVRHPLPHTGHMFVHPAGVQGLEDLLTPVHSAHFFFLKLGGFL